jgi:hypothetical protein
MVSHSSHDPRNGIAPGVCAVNGSFYSRAWMNGMLQHIEFSAGFFPRFAVVILL